MGDRALVQFTANERYAPPNAPPRISPVVYLHWMGPMVPTLINRTKELMAHRNAQPGDVEYTTARFIGIAHAMEPDDALSLGVWNRTDLLTEDDSHGDAGVFVVDITGPDWIVTHSGGYQPEQAAFNSGISLRFG